MYFRFILILFAAAVMSEQPRKCDQTPPQATVSEPITDKSLFRLKIGNAQNNTFIAMQTYALTLEAIDSKNKNFTWFMITAEDPEIDDKVYHFGRSVVDVGSLKTLDPSKSRYSERCSNTVESFDNTPKNKVEVHWVSPGKSEKVRIRAMVAENREAWYTGNNLTIILERDQSPPKDEPPYPPRLSCPLCSEARYEVLFKGRWSRLEHPRHYPSKPDENGYSYMIGASHDYNYTIWQPGVKAGPGMSALARDSDVSVLQRDIINNMSEKDGTRTLIRGKRRHHPNMHKWSHALFRVDRIHHLFTIVVAMRPSPDWFLGTKQFELCTDEGWLKEYKMPLYPWDAGVMDGVSYEMVRVNQIRGFIRGFRSDFCYDSQSPTSVTNPEGNIERVEVGSFDAESPFYQTNLNDLKPFAFLEIRRLDVYPLDPRECSDEEDAENVDGEIEVAEEESQDEPQADPVVAESRQYAGCLGEWSEWSPCVPDVGSCGIGAQTRTWVNGFNYRLDDEDDIQVLPSSGSCQANGDTHPMEIKDCIVDC